MSRRRVGNALACLAVLVLLVGCSGKTDPGLARKAVANLKKVPGCGSVDHERYQDKNAPDVYSCQGPDRTLTSILYVFDSDSAASDAMPGLEQTFLRFTSRKGVLVFTTDSDTGDRLMRETIRLSAVHR